MSLHCLVTAKRCRWPHDRHHCDHGGDGGGASLDHEDHSSDPRTGGESDKRCLDEGLCRVAFILAPYVRSRKYVDDDEPINTLGHFGRPLLHTILMILSLPSPWYSTRRSPKVVVRVLHPSLALLSLVEVVLELPVAATLFGGVTNPYRITTKICARVLPFHVDDRPSREHYAPTPTVRTFQSLVLMTLVYIRLRRPVV